jgi:hypothetical protein
VVLRLGPVRNRALLLRTLDDVEGGSHSVRELQFLSIVRRAGLPAPARQVVRRRPGGRYYLECGVDAYSLHGRGRRARASARGREGRGRRPRDELALCAPMRHAPCDPGLLLDERREHVVYQVRRGLLAGGWSPDGRRMWRSTRPPERQIATPGRGDPREGDRGATRPRRRGRRTSGRGPPGRRGARGLATGRPGPLTQPRLNPRHAPRAQG